MDVAAGVATNNAFLNAFQLVSALGITGILFPKPATVSDGASFNYIIVGGGTSGAMIAKGLTDDPNVNVLLIEAGGDPPIESVLPGLFPFLPNSAYDWKFTSVDDGYSAQSQNNKIVQFPQGKMLGGSSSLDHILHIRNNPADFEYWAEITQDDSWKWDTMLAYFKQNERLLDSEVLNSEYKKYHGLNGFYNLTRAPTDTMVPYLQAVEEIGYKSVLDFNTDDNLGFTQPLLTSDTLRQSSAISFLSPIKDRSNLFVLKNTLVTQIQFEGNVAVGVKAIDANNQTLNLKASKEVIVSAGTFNTAALLMRSGIGPKQHLESLGIKVIADLPVGQNLQDHPSVPLFYQMESTDGPQPEFDATTLPVPCFVGHVNYNDSHKFPDYQAIGIVIPHDSTLMSPLCSNGFGYGDILCQAVLNAIVGRNILWVFMSKLHPESRGQVLLKSTDPNDAPLIYTGAYSNAVDMETKKAYIKDFNRILGSSYFKSVGAQFVDPKFPNCNGIEFDTDEYWTCYILNAATTLFHYSGTAALGSVVDTELKVVGVSNLRVADASVLPRIVSGKIRETVMGVAAKAVDLIRGTKIAVTQSSDSNGAASIASGTQASQSTASQTEASKTKASQPGLLPALLGGTANLVSDVVTDLTGTLGGVLKSVGK